MAVLEELNDNDDIPLLEMATENEDLCDQVYGWSSSDCDDDDETFTGENFYSRSIPESPYYSRAVQSFRKRMNATGPNSRSNLYHRSVRNRNGTRKIPAPHFQDPSQESISRSSSENSLLGNPLISRLLWGLLFAFWVGGVCVVVHRVKELNARNYTMEDVMDLWTNGAPIH